MNQTIFTIIVGGIILWWYLTPKLDLDLSVIITLVPSDFQTYFTNSIKKYNLDPYLLYAIIMKESSWNPNAIRFEPKLNESSIGLGQILFPSTARQWGFKGTEEELFDPEVNIDWTSYILRRQNLRYKENLTDTIAAYNAGSVRLDNKTGLYVNQEYVDEVILIYNDAIEVTTT